jgi:hypothetical protein
VVLSAGEVADQAVLLLGSRRVVLSVPRWRGGLVRAAGLAPPVSKRAMRLVEAPRRRAAARSGVRRVLDAFEHVLYRRTRVRSNA